LAGARPARPGQDALEHKGNDTSNANDVGACGAHGGGQDVFVHESAHEEAVVVSTNSRVIPNVGLLFTA